MHHALKICEKEFKSKFSTEENCTLELLGGTGAKGTSY